MSIHGKRGFVERREGNRHISVFRVGRLVFDGKDQLCVIRNISSGGVMIESNYAPPVDSHILIELRSDRSLPATVRWSRDREAGVSFETPIDVAAMLREERPSILRMHPRAPRFQRHGRARIMGRQQTVDGNIDNISINGLAVHASGAFAKDEPVVVVIDGLGATHAAVRWTTHDGVGLKLNAPLSYRALADWLDDRAGKP